MWWFSGSSLPGVHSHGLWQHKWVERDPPTRNPPCFPCRVSQKALPCGKGAALLYILIAMDSNPGLLLLRYMFRTMEAIPKDCLLLLAQSRSSGGPTAPPPPCVGGGDVHLCARVSQHVFHSHRRPSPAVLAQQKGMHSPKAPKPQSPREEGRPRQALSTSGEAILGAQGPLLCEPSQ